MAKKTTAAPTVELHADEVVPIDSLRPHPRNYKKHPEAQLAHLGQSLRDFGLFRSIVVAKDGTILAGHGVVLAAAANGATDVTVKRLDLDADSPAALKVLALDNELGKFAEVDDRQLTELLKELSSSSDGLYGTGYDKEMVAALTMITRHAREVPTMDSAAEWAGMPEYAAGETQFKLIVVFAGEAERERFVQEHAMRVDKKTGQTWSTRWPFTEREDVAGLEFKAVEAITG